ncbi:hypothetical protein M2375_002942 [Comamonas sp. BIGb0152]|uniref:hypothetical protein n=1 Tax=Comamonas sp. BIGb0152 TaxID=2940601 RepID=UPI00216856A9|nr:hypothetical protein [Comamonas sp. BIGb0152]MCS4294709.1 hypothetical protein [Comamonas sp. BIGb0152]
MTSNALIQSVKALFAIGAAVSMVACASFQPSTPEEVVAKNALAFTNARIKGDHAAAYAYTNAAYQKARTLEDYKKAYPGTFAQSAAIHDVKCDEEKCAVGIDLKVKPPLITKNLGTIDMYSKQTWLLEDGQWRLYVEP